MREPRPVDEDWHYSDDDDVDEMSGMQVFNPFDVDYDGLTTSEVEILTPDQKAQRWRDIEWEAEVRVDRWFEMP